MDGAVGRFFRHLTVSFPWRSFFFVIFVRSSLHPESSPAAWLVFGRFFHRFRQWEGQWLGEEEWVRFSAWESGEKGKRGFR